MSRGDTSSEKVRTPSNEVSTPINKHELRNEPFELTPQVIETFRMFSKRKHSNEMLALHEVAQGNNSRYGFCIKPK